MLAEAERPVGVFYAEDRRLFVEIRPGPIPDMDDLLVHVEVQLEGELIGESVTDTCLTCTSEEVAGMALMLLEPLLEQLPEPVPDHPPAPAIPAMGDAASVMSSRPATPRPVRVLSITGATLVGAGVIGLGVGVGLIAANERIVSPPGAAMLEVIEYREGGIATAVVGGLAIATGAALLGFALGQRQQLMLRAGPVGGSDTWGASLAGHF